MPALSFAFTKIVVTDLGAAEAFYTRTLGLSRVAFIEFGEGPSALREAVLSVPGGSPDRAQLNLICYPNRPVAAPTPKETVIGFMVDDVAATAATMTQAGAQITVPVTDLPDHGVKLAYLEGPEAQTIELLQPLQKPGA